MVLEASALTTVAAAQEDLVSDSGLEARAVATDARIERLIMAASASMAAWANRKFEYVEDFAELVTTTGDQFIRLQHAPVQSVEKIEWLNRDDEVIDTIRSWEIWRDGTTGMLYRGNRWPVVIGVPTSIEPKQIKNPVAARLRVTYTGGYITPAQAESDPMNATRSLPYDLEEACVREVVSAFWNRNRNREIDSRTTAEATVTFRENSAGLLRSTIGVLKRYWLGEPR